MGQQSLRPASYHWGANR